jgi:hypothetical protein
VALLRQGRTSLTPTRCWRRMSCSAPYLMPPLMGAKNGILR